MVRRLVTCTQIGAYALFDGLVSKVEELGNFVLTGLLDADVYVVCKD